MIEGKVYSLHHGTEDRRDVKVLSSNGGHALVEYVHVPEYLGFHWLGRQFTIHRTRYGKWKELKFDEHTGEFYV